MFRFFVEHGVLHPQTTIRLDSLAHQLHAVLRLKPGATVTLLDGSGSAYPAQIEQLDARHALLVVGDAQPGAAEPRLHLTLFQCSLKADKFEWVLQKGVELGVSRFVPVVSSRSIVRPLEALARKADRWRAVIREAAEQSGRSRLPELAAPQEYEDAIAAASGLRLLPWEEIAGDAAPISLAGVKSATLLVGPEGGLTQQEARAAQAAGWQLISLGNRILRAETAAIAAAAALFTLSGDLGALGSSTTAPPI